MAEDKKYFVWMENNHLSWGPFYAGYVEEIGKQHGHELTDLERIFDGSKLKTLRGARIGTKIKIHRLHSAGSLYLKRVSEEQYTRIMDLNKIDGLIDLKRQELATLQAKREQLVSLIIK